MAETNLSTKGARGAVVTIEKNATQVGISILKSGGNAIDSAIATAFALAVTHPFAGNLGGGGFMLIRLASGETVGIDFREMAPGLATPGMFLKQDGSVDQEKASFGYLVAAIPGTIKGLETAWKQYGSLPWKDLVQPSIQLAQQGIYLNKYDVAELKKYQADLDRFPETKKIFYKNNKELYGTKDLFKQPELAHTLQVISRGGAKGFYEGEIADKIVADTQANGGIITVEDLQSYTVKIRQPLKSEFQGYEIIGMPMPSAGGISLINLLQTLQHFPLNRDPLDPDNLHILIECMRPVFLERTTYLGDSDFVQVPVEEMLSESKARERAKNINLKQVTSSQSLSGDVSVHKENIETTHFSVIDEAGNMVATTITLEDAFGSKAVVKGLGFLLNSEMHDFNINPYLSNIQGINPTNPNGIAPYKRMLSSMTPTLVLKDNRPFLITGSPGGRTIVNTILQIILGLITYQLSLKEVLRLPRLSHLWMPDDVHLEKNSWSPEIIQALQDKGHKIKIGDYLGDAHSIWVNPDNGLYEAEADPRRNGWAEAF